MFVRVKSTPNSPRKSVQIVQSIRRGDKIIQKIVRYVGIAMDDSELEQLKMLGESIKVKLEAEHQQLLLSPEQLAQIAYDSKKNMKKEKKKEDDYKVNLKNLVEEQRIVKGIHDVYGRLFDELGYRNIFKNPARSAALVKMFKNIVLARVANPLSKMASVDMLEEDFGITLDLQKIYRMMDRIDEEAIDKLNEITYHNTAQLFKQKLDVLFFDATTIYFEAFTEDDLRKNGYSKDLKFNQPQVLLSLLVTKEGLPVGYKIFPGNTYEGHTLIPTLKELQVKYNLDKIIFVADAGMFNINNLTSLEDNGFEYIVSARLKNFNTDIKKQILDPNNYQLCASRQENGEFRIARLKLPDDKFLIVSFSSRRAAKDKRERDKAIEKLTQKLEKKTQEKDFWSNYGYKKYLKIIGQNQVELNQEKITEDEKWDGLHGVVTNAVNLANEEILKQYNNLWNVENAFRLTKHDLKVRPVFHWAQRRIKAHMAISFAAYALIKNLEYRVKLQYRKMSPEKIRQTLVRVQTSILFDKKKNIRYGLPSRISQEAIKIYRLMHLTPQLTPYIIQKM